MKLSIIEVLRSNLCGYIGAYILVRDDIISTEDINPTSGTFKNCGKFTKSTKKFI